VPVTINKEQVNCP